MRYVRSAVIMNATQAAGHTAYAHTHEIKKDSRPWLDGLRYSR